jgi:hypothetical protein
MGRNALSLSNGTNAEKVIRKLGWGPSSKLLISATTTCSLAHGFSLGTCANEEGHQSVDTAIFPARERDQLG